MHFCTLKLDERYNKTVTCFNIDTRFCYYQQVVNKWRMHREMYHRSNILRQSITLNYYDVIVYNKLQIVRNYTCSFITNSITKLRTKITQSISLEEFSKFSNSITNYNSIIWNFNYAITKLLGIYCNCYLLLTEIN